MKTLFLSPPSFDGGAASRYHLHPKPILRIIKTMLEDKDVFVRRCPEGYESFKSLRQRKEDLEAARMAAKQGVPAFGSPTLRSNCNEKKCNELLCNWSYDEILMTTLNQNGVSSVIIFRWQRKHSPLTEVKP